MIIRGGRSRGIDLRHRRRRLLDGDDYIITTRTKILASQSTRWWIRNTAAQRVGMDTAHVHFIETVRGHQQLTCPSKRLQKLHAPAFGNIAWPVGLLNWRPANGHILKDEAAMKCGAQIRTGWNKSMIVDRGLTGQPSVKNDELKSGWLCASTTAIASFKTLTRAEHSIAQ